MLAVHTAAAQTVMWQPGVHANDARPGTHCTAVKRALPRVSGAHHAEALPGSRQAGGTEERFLWDLWQRRRAAAQVPAVAAAVRFAQQHDLRVGRAVLDESCAVAHLARLAVRAGRVALSARLRCDGCCLRAVGLLLLMLLMLLELLLLVVMLLLLVRQRRSWQLVLAKHRRRAAMPWLTSREARRREPWREGLWSQPVRMREALRRSKPWPRNLQSAAIQVC